VTVTYNNFLERHKTAVLIHSSFFILHYSFLFRCPNGTAEVLSALTASFPSYTPNQNPRRNTTFISRF